MMLDETGSIEGMSPHYSAPEQFDTEQYGSPNDQTDIYQIGTLIYELLTGNPPFEGSITAVMQGVLSEKPTPPSEVADLPKAVDNLLMPALQKEQADRYDSLVYLRDGLSELTTSDWSNVETTTSSIKTRSPSEVSSTNKSTIKEAQPNEDANRPQKQNEALKTKVDSDPSTSENKRFLANRRSILVVLGIGTIGVGGWQANSHNLFSSSNSPTADEDGTQESSTSDTEQESTSDTTSNGGNTEPSTNEESSEEIDRANAFLADEGADGANGYDGSLVDETGSDSVTIANGAGDGYTYDPPGVIIDAGTTVTWEWTDQGGNHNVVSMEEGDYDMESELTDEEGFTFENTFEEAGVSLYYCQPHRARGMAGAIVIM
jgi:serine/threonine-protein kinase